MAKENEPGPGQEYDDTARERFPIADVVSLESVVNMLIRKGICTPEELYQEEQKNREQPRRESVPIVRIERQDVGTGTGNGVHRHKKSGWLKRKMSKQRWTRRLGTSLFGWEWKKTKNHRKSGEEESQK